MSWWKAEVVKKYVAGELSPRQYLDALRAGEEVKDSLWDSSRPLSDYMQNRDKINADVLKGLRTKGFLPQSKPSDSLHVLKFDYSPPQRDIVVIKESCWDLFGKRYTVTQSPRWFGGTKTTLTPPEPGFWDFLFGK